MRCRIFKQIHHCVPTRCTCERETQFTTYFLKWSLVAMETHHLGYYETRSWGWHIHMARVRQRGRTDALKKGLSIANPWEQLGSWMYIRWHRGRQTYIYKKFMNRLSTCFLTEVWRFSTGNTRIHAHLRRGSSWDLYLFIDTRLQPHTNPPCPTESQ